MKKSLSLAILCATVFLCSSGARAQNAISTGSISGHVTDNTGGVILGVKVTATSVETGVQRTTKTSEAGLYNFPGLNVGAYTLTFNQSGFKTTEIKNVVVQVGQATSEDVSAVYGGAGTGFINTVTKSGGDSFHGDAFYYNRNSSVGNANDAIDKANGIRTPLNVLQQFGGDLGGPVARHKAWFYFDYEQQRQKEPISVINSGFAGIDETAFGVTQGTALPAPNATYPVPSTFSAPPPSTDTTHYPIYLQQVSNALSALTRNLGQRQRRRDDLEFLPKLDWQPTQADHLTFLYNYNRLIRPAARSRSTPSPATA